MRVCVCLRDRMRVCVSPSCTCVYLRDRMRVCVSERHNASARAHGGEVLYCT